MIQRVVLGVAVIVACACATQAELVTLDTGGFIGIVDTVAFDNTYVVNRESLPWLVGPVTLTLTDGRVLEVQEATPGQIDCIGLMRAEDWEERTGFDDPSQEMRMHELAYRPCTVIGAFDESGLVDWFVVADTTADGHIVLVNGMRAIDGDRVIAPLSGGDWPGDVAMPF